MSWRQCGRDVQRPSHRRRCGGARTSGAGGGSIDAEGGRRRGMLAPPQRRAIAATRGTVLRRSKTRGKHGTFSALTFLIAAGHAVRCMLHRSRGKMGGWERHAAKSCNAVQHTATRRLAQRVALHHQSLDAARSAAARARTFNSASSSLVCKQRRKIRRKGQCISALAWSVAAAGVWPQQ